MFDPRPLSRRCRAWLKDLAGRSRRCEAAPEAASSTCIIDESAAAARGCDADLERMRQAIARLEDSDYRIFWLNRVERRTAAEIASCLNIPERRVRRRLRHVVRRLLASDFQSGRR